MARAIKDRAKRKRVSLNRAVVELLEEATGRPPGGVGASKRALRYDLDKYAGSWTKQEADEFDVSLKEQRKVDPRDWE